MIECMGMGSMRQVPPISIIQISKLIDWIYKNLKIWLTCPARPSFSSFYLAFYCPLLHQLSPTVTFTQLPAPPALYAKLDTTSHPVEQSALPMIALPWPNVLSVTAHLPVLGVISDTSLIRLEPPALKSPALIPAAMSALAHLQTLATVALNLIM